MQIREKMMARRQTVSGICAGPWLSRQARSAVTVGFCCWLQPFSGGGGAMRRAILRQTSSWGSGARAATLGRQNPSKTARKGQDR